MARNNRKTTTEAPAEAPPAETPAANPPADPAADAPAKAGKPAQAPTHVRITARRDGFRRAGMAHSRTSTVHPIGAFSKAQLDTLNAEPRLIVEMISEK